MFQEIQNLTITIGLTEDKFVYDLKPFIPYSCRYIKGTSYDFVVNYTLDNTITIIGKVDGVDVTKSGHLIELPGTVPNYYELTDDNKDEIDEYIIENIDAGLNENETLEENLVIIEDTGDFEVNPGNLHANHAKKYEYVVYKS